MTGAIIKAAIGYTKEALEEIGNRPLPVQILAHMLI